jgi:hypothetical protein
MERSLHTIHETTTMECYAEIPPIPHATAFDCEDDDDDEEMMVYQSEAGAAPTTPPPMRRAFDLRPPANIFKRMDAAASAKHRTIGAEDLAECPQVPDLDDSDDDFLRDVDGWDSGIVILPRHSQWNGEEFHFDFPVNHLRIPSLASVSSSDDGEEQRRAMPPPVPREGKKPAPQGKTMNTRSTLLPLSSDARANFYGAIAA